MLNKFKNLFLSVQHYQILSPDWRVRHRVNRALQYRPALEFNDWFSQQCQPLGIIQPIAYFAYTRLEHYSGLSFARVRVGDRLKNQLHWTEVCWFDWEIRLCQDFWCDFEVDISSALDQFDPTTVEDLLTFLNHQLVTESQRC